MSRDIFSKTVTTKTIDSATVSLSDNTITKNEPVKVSGSLKDHEIANLLVEKFGENTLVSSVTEEKRKYKFSVQDILKYAIESEEV